jgi:hypothetical protein
MNLTPKNNPILDELDKPESEAPKVERPEIPHSLMLYMADMMHVPKNEFAFISSEIRKFLDEVKYGNAYELAGKAANYVNRFNRERRVIFKKSDYDHFVSLLIVLAVARDM